MKRRTMIGDMAREVPVFFWVIWGLSALASITAFAVVIWAVIKVVNHFT